MSERTPETDLLGEPVRRRRVGRRDQVRLHLTFSEKHSYHLQICQVRQVCQVRQACATGGGDATSQGDADPVRLVAQLGARWANALRTRYPARDAAKRIARDFDVSPRTAKGWLSGQAPYAGYLAMAARGFGLSILAEVLAPGADWGAAVDLTARLGALQAELQKLSSKMVVLRKGEADDPSTDADGSAD